MCSILAFLLTDIEQEIFKAFLQNWITGRTKSWTDIFGKWPTQLSDNTGNITVTKPKSNRLNNTLINEINSHTF